MPSPFKILDASLQIPDRVFGLSRVAVDNSRSKINQNTSNQVRVNRPLGEFESLQVILFRACEYTLEEIHGSEPPIYMSEKLPVERRLLEARSSDQMVSSNSEFVYFDVCASKRVMSLTHAKVI